MFMHPVKSINKPVEQVVYIRNHGEITEVYGQVDIHFRSTAMRTAQCINSYIVSYTYLILYILIEIIITISFISL